MLAPYVAQQIAFSIARGQELGRAQVAKKELAGLPAAASRYALVAKIIEPSVVGIETTIHVASPFGDGGFSSRKCRPCRKGRG